MGSVDEPSIFSAQARRRRLLSKARHRLDYGYFAVGLPDGSYLPVLSASPRQVSARPYSSARTPRSRSCTSASTTAPGCSQEATSFVQPSSQADGLDIPDVVGRYQDALARGDLDAIVECFEEDGYFREPSGGDFVYRGRDAVREADAFLFSNGGGIPLEHCTLTDDGTHCAIEYNVVRRDKTDLPPQPGVAIYERGRAGLLAAARVYDDVDAPLG